MQYRAKPIIVDAKVITHVADIINSEGNLQLKVKVRPNDESELDFTATKEMMSRMKPVVGDYVVTQPDGYEYLNPKEVFEGKYERV